MKTSIEISMYPLRDDYASQVLNFLELLNSHPFIKVETNGMSTQVFGDFDRAFKAIQDSISEVYKSGVKASFIVKVLPGIVPKFEN